MRPALTAALDQADAAGRDAAATLYAIASTTPGRWTYNRCPAGTRTGPAVEDVLARLRTRMLEGLPRCRHAGGSGQLWWCAWRPSLLRCRPCAAVVSLRARGTVEDHTCDACRRRGRVHPYAVALPAVVVDLEQPVVLPAVLAVFGLCRRCHELGRVVA